MRLHLPGFKIFVLFLSFRCTLTLHSFHSPTENQRFAFFVSKTNSEFDYNDINGDFNGKSNINTINNINNRVYRTNQDRFRGGRNLIRNFSVGIDQDVASFRRPGSDKGVLKPYGNNVSSGITEREVSYRPYWKAYDDDNNNNNDDDKEDPCHPSCFCEFPDRATCVGPRITFVPTRLNPFLTHLEIVDASLLSIRTDSFSAYRHLQHLSLINCSVVKLEAFAFRGLSGLQTFNLNLNPLTHLSRYSFSGLFNVRVLNLTRNRVKRIHSLAFESSSFIGKLLLYRNPLAHISARAFLGLSHVDSLIVSEVRWETSSVFWEV